MDGAAELQRTVTDFVRSFGLHQPDRTACGQPIGTSEAHALSVIGQRPGIRMTQLADELVLEKSTVSRLVVSLTQKGWLEAKPDERDRRARTMKLTAAGNRAAKRLAEARARHFETILRRLPEESRGPALAGLAALAEAARSARQGGSEVASA